MRLFTGIPVSKEFIDSFIALGNQNPAVSGLRWTRRENLHVTTCFLGERPEAMLPAIRELIARISKDYGPMQLDLDRICFWPISKPYMIWALYRESKAFTAFYRALESSLLGKAGNGAVKPHVTLARFKEFTDMRRITLASERFPVILNIERITLFESRLLPEGPVYTSLETHLLKGITPGP